MSQPKLLVRLLQIIHMRHKKQLIVIASLLADKRQDRVVGDPLWTLALLLELLLFFDSFTIALRLTLDHALYIDGVWLDGNLFDIFSVLQSV